MEILLNVGRYAMLGWIVYALLLLFAPGAIHQAANQTSGIIRVIVAFLIGNLLDRALRFVRRRRAKVPASNP